MMMMKNILIAVLLTFTLFNLLHAEEELLPPDEAFAFTATIKGDQLQLDWNIAKGYYLYRDKTRISSSTSGISLESLNLPKGKIKKDEFFGDVAILRNQVPASVGVKRSDSSLNTFSLVAKFQGCADLGVCYPPITKTINLSLAKSSFETSNSSNSSAISSLGDFGNSVGAGADDGVLDPDQAFQYQIDMEDPNTLIARWQIAPDHYMYRDKIKFNIVDSNGITLGRIITSPGEKKHDEFFGDIEVYHHQTEARISLIRTSKEPQKLSIKATYQGCAELTGICYPPIKKTSQFELPVATVLLSATEAITESTESKPVENEFISEQDISLAVLRSGNMIEILVYFFLGGLALAFTACMYPMIPILSSIIVGHGENINRKTAFTISMAYVQSMAVTFGILGAVVALFAGGVNLQASFQSPWILIPFSILFVALAFSMFGFYSIQMPASVQSWLSNFSNKQEGGTLHGAIFMGAASALIIGPCAGPVIIGALAYVAAESDWKLGFLAMFILGNGLGLPLLAVGTLGGHVLPRAGTWMDTVKATSGVILLAIALLFLERISFISSTMIMLLWATLFVVSGIYMGAFQPIKEGASNWHKLWKGLGLMFVLYGAIVMLGGLTGARNFNDPMHGSSLTMNNGGAGVEEHLKFKRIKSADDLKRELASAKAAGKYVMLDFYADWCTYCKQFEDYVFNQSDVQAMLKDFVLLQADVTANDDMDQQLNQFTQVQAPPAILFFDKQGKEIKSYRIVGAMDHPTFIQHVKKIMQL